MADDKIRFDFKNLVGIDVELVPMSSNIRLTWTIFRARPLDGSTAYYYRKGAENGYGNIRMMKHA